MDALPGTPQIQNIIPTTFFGTNTWAAPLLGTLGGVFILVARLAYLEWRRASRAAAGEGYGTDLLNEPAPFAGDRLANPLARDLAAGAGRRVEQGVHRADPAALRRQPSNSRPR